MRFPILLDALRVRKDNASRIILATLTLHNFLINTGAGFIDEYRGEDEENEIELQQQQNDEPEDGDNEIVRSALCQLV